MGRKLPRSSMSHSFDAVISRLTHEDSIVAVHGLNPQGKDNHATDTWTKKSGGSNRNWLRDDLPHDMPDVRVLLYEYDSFPVLMSTKTRFVHQASDLLYCLDMERDTVRVCD